MFTTLYWDEAGHDRLELLERTSRHLAEQQWTLHQDSGWNAWDLEIYGHPWTALQLTTVQEEHGGGKRLLRVRFRLRSCGYLKTFAFLGATVTLLATVTHPALSLGIGALLAGFGLAVWRRGIQLASRVEAIVDGIAAQMDLLRCPEPEGDDQGAEVSSARDASKAGVGVPSSRAVVADEVCLSEAGYGKKPKRLRP